MRLERCIHMIKMNNLAARRFYQFAAEMMDVEAAMMFMLNILSSVKIWIKSKTGAESAEDKENHGKKRRKLYSDSESSVMMEEEEQSTVLENTSNTNNTACEQNTGVDSSDEDHPYNDESVVGGVLDIVCVIWNAKISEICRPEHDEMRSALEKKAGKWMMLFFKYFKHTPVIRTVVSALLWLLLDNND